VTNNMLFVFAQGKLDYVEGFTYLRSVIYSDGDVGSNNVTYFVQNTHIVLSQ